MICYTCKEDKPESDFSVEKRGYRRKSCKSCRTKSVTKYRASGEGRVKAKVLNVRFHQNHPGYYAQFLSDKRVAQMYGARNKIVQRNRKFVQEAKSRPCVDCGIQYPFYVMDFDHVRGKKVENIATMVGHARKLEVLVAEIAKCELVCSNCHRIRTYKRRQSR